MWKQANFDFAYNVKATQMFKSNSARGNYLICLFGSKNGLDNHWHLNMYSNNATRKNPNMHTALRRSCNCRWQRGHRDKAAVGLSIKGCMCPLARASKVTWRCHELILTHARRNKSSLLSPSGFKPRIRATQISWSIAMCIQLCFTLITHHGLFWPSGADLYNTQTSCPSEGAFH